MHHGEEITCVVPVKREIDEDKMLSTLKFTKGITRKEPTFLATLKLHEEAKEVQAPKVILRVLDEFLGKNSSFKFINPKRKVHRCVLRVSSVGSCVLSTGIN